MKIKYMWLQKLSTRIRLAHKSDPALSPKEIAQTLETSPKYVSKILRRAKAKKFRTGPKPKGAPKSK